MVPAAGAASASASASAGRRQIRHDVDVVLVSPPIPGQGPGTQTAARGRVVAWEDGRWALHLPVRGEWVEIRGDRWSESRPVALMLLRASGLA